MEQPASNPGIVIAPMGVGEIIDASFNLTRRHYKRLFLIGAWGLVPAGVVSAVQNALFADQVPFAPESLTWVVPAILLGLAASFGTLLAYGAVTIACARIIEPTGAPNELDPGPLYRAALGRFWAQLGWVAILLALAVPLIILFPLGIYLYIRWVLSWGAILIEREGPISCLKRSWALTRRAWWHAFGVLLVAGIILMIVTLVVVGVLAALGAAAGFLVGNTALTQVLTSVAGTIGNLVIAPVSVAYYVVLYYELRARNEGFDLAQRARQTTPM